MDAGALQQACRGLQKVLDEAHALTQDIGGLKKISDAPASFVKLNNTVFNVGASDNH